MGRLAQAPLSLASLDSSPSGGAKGRAATDRPYGGAPGRRALRRRSALKEFSILNSQFILHPAFLHSAFFISYLISPISTLHSLLFPLYSSSTAPSSIRSKNWTSMTVPVGAVSPGDTLWLSAVEVLP